MKPLTRRDFVRITAAAAGGLLAPRTSRAADARIEIVTTERIGHVTADLYGHFVEHLGAVLQRTGRHEHACEHAGGGRRPRAVQRQVLGDREPIVGLRRRVYARGIRHRVPALRRVGAPIRRGPGVPLTLTVVNPHVSEPRSMEIALRGASPGSAQAVVLAAPTIHAHNTFSQPRNVQPRPQKVEAPRNGILVHEFPPASVTRITLNLL